MSWKKYFKPVAGVQYKTNASSGSANASVSKFSNWLPEVYQGPPNRLQRYVQYEQMDLDHEVNASLDTLAEFSTQMDERTGIPFQIRWKGDPSPSEISVLEKVLKQWCYLNEFPQRMFRIFRSTLIYGDQFFIRDPETFKLIWMDPNTVESVIVNESKGKDIEVYFMNDVALNLQESTGSDMSKKNRGGYGSADSVFPNATIGAQANYNTANATPALNNGGTYSTGGESFPVDACHVVQVSLTEGMDSAWPFGISVLEPIFKVYKQKELLEDSVLIYRIHRAPERRVFKIDVGTMPPQKAQQYLEKIKYEVQQKRIPSRTGGGASIVDSSYNPMSMLEDYYFAQTSDGRGSDVTTLPGGENMGEIDDLRYFNNKMMRALGVPSSYLATGPEDGTDSYNDGRVGTAFIQEFRFSKTCQRHQEKIVEPFDQEFKLFLKKKGYDGIDTSTFEIKFTEPQNFSKYRQIELDSSMLNNFGSVTDIPFISKQFALKKYLGWTKEEIKENEKLWQQENPKDKPANMSDSDLGVGAGMGEVGLGMGGGGFDMGDEGDFDTDDAEADIDMEGTGDVEPGPDFGDE